jgi:uncharacterized protein
MKEIIDQKTLEAIRHYGDATTEEFYRRLRERRFMSTRCTACGDVAFPPRGFCPACHQRDVTWIDLPVRGTLYAFTQQQRSIRFSAPDVIGLVELAGVGHILTRIDAPFELLSIGQPMQLDFYEVSREIVLHQFRPVG